MSNSVYLLCWYKRANTGAEGAASDDAFNGKEGAAVRIAKKKKQYPQRLVCQYLYFCTSIEKIE